MVVASFVFFLLLFFGIGLASVARAKRSGDDYYLASSSVPPWLTGLSAVATQNSGYAFIGFIGFAHIAGLTTIWLMLGWIVGDFLGSLFVHKRLRQITEQTQEASFLAVLARWGGGDFVVWRRLAAVVTILFLGAYASAQITAGSKALVGVLGWHPYAGAIVIAMMVMAYSAAGGIRASIWTDAAQAIIMLLALLILVYVCVENRGGINQTLMELQSIPSYMDWQPTDLAFPGVTGMLLFLAGWLFAGFSVVGQPHIMVRFMAMRDPGEMIRVRLWYYGYFVVFFSAGIAVGLASRLYADQFGGVDPEMTLPTLAVEMLPPYLVGLILAGMFSATMSTADSLVLSCSASISHDLLPRRLERTWEMKAATALVTLTALAFALIEVRSVFHLVILAWSAIASAFGPLVVLRALDRTINEAGAIVMMFTGLGVALLWRVADLHSAVYEGLPGIVAGLAVGAILSMPKTQQAKRSLHDA